jgi:hypothetical protein
MHDRIDLVTGNTPARVPPVDSIPAQRRSVPEERSTLAPAEPGALFAPQSADSPNAYVPPADAALPAHHPAEPAPVAPALARALAAEPWGHPMPVKSVWEQAAAVREHPAVAQAPPETAIATTAAAPATEAAVSGSGSAAPPSQTALAPLMRPRM